VCIKLPNKRNKMLGCASGVVLPFEWHPDLNKCQFRFMSGAVELDHMTFLSEITYHTYRSTSLHNARTEVASKKNR